MSQTVINPHEFYDLLAHFRRVRRLSQLGLLVADVSARHISFLETGRTSPSARMVRRLAEALDLSAREEDALLLAAGFAPRTHLRMETLDRIAGNNGDLVTAVCGTALAIAGARTETELFELTRERLPDLGVSHFFVSRLRPDGVGDYAIDLLSTDAFPVEWLNGYAERGYARHDPFLRALKVRDDGFFWADVLRGPSEGGERELLDTSYQLGLTGGYVLPLRRRDGSIQGVSMMGAEVEHADPRVRLSLQTLCLAIAQKWPDLDLTDPAPRRLSRDDQALLP